MKKTKIEFTKKIGFLVGLNIKAAFLDSYYWKLVESADNANRI